MRTIGPVITRKRHRMGGGVSETVEDEVVVEAPLEIAVAGESALVVMRTPGADEELVRGLLFAEGSIDSAEELATVQPVDTDASDVFRGTTVEVTLTGTRPIAKRAVVSSSSCGVCGRLTLGDLDSKLRSVRSDLRVSLEVITSIPSRLRDSQILFDRTGGLHAAGIFDDNGTLLCIREDVGRHNAVDKVIGWMLAAPGVTAADSVLAVSGRVSFEILQKTIRAGFPLVVAVSAPSSLAVDLAERYRVTLCAFVRGASANVYSHPSRIDVA